MLFYFIFQYYYIKSHLNGLVLDVGDSKESPGAPVFPFKRHDGPNQQWRIDTATGIIRSRLNDFCMDIGGKTLNFRIRLYYFVLRKSCSSSSNCSCSVGSCSIGSSRFSNSTNQ